MGQTTDQDGLARARFGTLDGLRALCILAVLWHHGLPLTPRPGRSLAESGFLGVDVFFVLSGFLITTLLLREERTKGFFSCSQFYLRRALRILPAYLATLALAFVRHAGLRGGSLESLPLYLLFLSNFLPETVPFLGPTWSLAVEEQFYLIWPFLLAVLPRRAIGLVLVAMIAANVLGGLAGGAIEWGPLLLRLPNATYAPILIGAGLALILDRPAGYRGMLGLFGHRAAAPVAAGLMVLLAATLPADLRGWPNLALHLTMAALLAALVLREDNGLAWLLRWRPLARLGVVSYGVYLYHPFVLWGAQRLLPGPAPQGGAGLWLQLVVYGALTWALAEVSFRLFETPIQRWGRKRWGK